jgi:hypothetical protein
MTYPGGKSGSGVHQALINLMPPHETYIEPFLGGGAILRLKRPAAHSIGVDLDPEVIGWWSARLSSLATNGYSAGDIPMWRVPPRSRIAGSAIAVPAVACRRPTPEWAMPPGHTSAIHGEGIQFLRDYPFTGGELVYCDPPYLMETRSSGRLYRHEMTEAQHGELLDVIKGLRCRVMISGYSSVLYARELKTWHAAAFPAATRGGLAAEWVWSNFPRPVELHDYRFLGADYRERERLRRQQRRWKAKLAAMPVTQRQALLAAIADTA